MRMSMQPQPALTRRETLRHSLAVAGWLAGAGLLPTSAIAQSGWNRAAFDARSVDTVLQALGVASPTLSDEVVLNLPDLADDGATVPVAVSTALAGVRRLALLVEKNPSVLVAVFDVTEAVDASVALRIKMAESSNVYAVAILADGRVLYAVKDVKVTLGGCGA
jgi:sulfur-oxidizing protein SoxY